MSSNSVCNHTRDKQIRLPLRGRPILLSLVWLQTELDSTQSFYRCIYSYFKKRFQMISKKPINQDCKVILEFLKLANNAGGVWYYPYYLAVLAYGVLAFFFYLFWNSCTYTM